MGGSFPHFFINTGRRRKNGGKGTEERERERIKKKGFHFFLRSKEIRPPVFVRERGKVGPRNKGYAWVPKSRSFVKIQEVGNFLFGLFLT